MPHPGPLRDSANYQRLTIAHHRLGSHSFRFEPRNEFASSWILSLRALPDDSPPLAAAASEPRRERAFGRVSLGRTSPTLAARAAKTSPHRKCRALVCAVQDRIGHGGASSHRPSRHRSGGVLPTMRIPACPGVLARAHAAQGPIAIPAPPDPGGSPCIPWCSTDGAPECAGHPSSHLDLLPASPRCSSQNGPKMRWFMRNLAAKIHCSSLF